MFKRIQNENATNERRRIVKRIQNENATNVNECEQMWLYQTADLRREYLNEYRTNVNLQ